MSNAKTIEDTYCDKDLYTHIIDLPDSYIGSIERSESNCWIYNSEMDKIINKPIQYIPGLYKIYDEIIVNAYDQYTRLNMQKNIKNPVTIIKVDIDKENNTISIFNNGEGIPVEIHKKINVYVPEMIFGILLTSSNYGKDEKKLTGGKNGFGAKLTNIFSTEFTIETVDSERKRKYIQTFTNNMLNKGTPVITEYNNKPYTKITFKPDLTMFKLKELEQDIVSLMERRVYDIAACIGNSVNVYLNNKLIDCKTIDKYANYFFDKTVKKVYCVGNDTDRWEVCVAVNPDVKFEQISFVNGIHTVNGGKHVDAVVKHICRKIQNVISKNGYKRKKNLKITQDNLKDNMFVFVRSMIENPAFKGQIKEYLTTDPANFGSKFEIDDKDVEKLMKTQLVDRAIQMGQMKTEMNIPNIDESEKKTSYIRIAKLDDANHAGSKDSLKCTLILTEGDSAKTLAISGLSVVGRDYFGVYPLKGKPLNVRECTNESIMKNVEISSLFKILGLTIGMLNKYTDKTKKLELLKKKLRYGRIMIFADQDVDGTHIKGLIINIFHDIFPEILDLDEFIISLATPIIKLTKGSGNNKEIKDFYTLSEYKEWMTTSNDYKSWSKPKYFKGLGTSTSAEGKEYFKDFENKKITFKRSEDEQSIDNGFIKIMNKSDEALKNAFDKKCANIRKDMIANYNKSNIIEQNEKIITYERFINNDLIHHMIYNCDRAIPSMCDGLKTSQRKILYAAIKRNLKNEIKVSQFAGYVSEHSGYHHGEASLCGTIVGMAQDYVGANNQELFVPNGQFGTRLQGGKDSASERYIFTCMHPITQLIFHPDDYPLMNYKEDDGMSVEPEFYIPIIPMILVNGACGIATGYSANVPCHNPLDIIENLYKLMENKEPNKIKPWFRGFTGEIVYRESNNSYTNKGRYLVNKNLGIVEIIELPIGTWTDNYKDYLYSLIYDKVGDKVGDEKKKIEKYLLKVDSKCNETKVYFKLHFKPSVLSELIDKKTLDSILKLTDDTNSSYTNMHMFTKNGVITKYSSVEDILKEFYLIRLDYYVKRKEYKLKIVKRELDIISMKIKFINDFINNEIQIIEMDDDDIYEQLEEREYIKFPKNPKEIDNVDDELTYDYLLNMMIRTLTKKKMNELKNKHELKKTEYNELLEKNIIDIWKYDLNNFKEMYIKYLNIHTEKMNMIEKPIPAAKKKK